MQKNVFCTTRRTLLNWFVRPFAGDASRQVNDLKFKLVKAEQEVTALEQNVRSGRRRSTTHTWPLMLCPRDPLRADP